MDLSHLWSCDQNAEKTETENYNVQCEWYMYEITLNQTVYINLYPMIRSFEPRDHFHLQLSLWT